MILPKNLRKSKLIKGQSYLEIIITIAILSILGAALFSLIATSYELISFARARTTALHLAQEKMELFRNLPYDELGTQGGIPSGNLNQEEIALRNGLAYRVKTGIVYIDDPFDQLSPQDTVPTDYKRVRVEVSWEGVAASKKNPVVLVTDITPRGLESDAGGGVLSITVFNANAQPISDVSATIVANETDPVINLTLDTDSEGKIYLPGMPICNNCYQITVSKEDYNSERTYSSLEVANPAKPHLTILEGELTETSFVIDKLANLNIKTFLKQISGFTPLGNINFILEGKKIIGTDTEDNPVPKYRQSLSTNAVGELELEDFEWDNYTLILEEEGYDLSGTNPLLPFNLLPDTNLDFLLSLNSHSDHSLFLTFTDGVGIQIASVSATIKEGENEETKLAGSDIDPDFGQVFFSSLNELTYSLTASASGYATHSADINLSGNHQETIILNPE